MATTTPTLDTVATSLVSAMAAFLPAPVAGLPPPSVIMTNLSERSAGIGRRLGTDTAAGFGVIALKGIRLEGVARFQLWAAAPADVDAALSALNSRILAARDALWAQGVLKINMRDAKPAEHIQDVGWRRYADYRILYEFPYHDADDAESLLARIPIDIDSDLGESTVVTDHMSRWDNESAPALLARGPLGITALSALSFIPGASPAGAVTLTRTFDGAVGAPVAHATMADFLAAVSGDAPAQRHAAVTFASLNAFLAELNAAGSLITLGDWDANAILDQYQPLSRSVQPPVRLTGVPDRFEISYQDPAFDKIAVLYLRLARSAAT